jgi:FMN phosphatase YigB (HAD superfamily)
MEKYIALDVGNVLCTMDFKKFINSISKYTNLSVLESEHRVNRHQRLQDVGLTTMKQILESEFNIESEVILDDLLNVWNNNVLKFSPRIIEFFMDLNNRFDLKIAILSNVGIDHAFIINDYLNNYYKEEPSSICFKEAIRYFSCDVGVRKPQSLYYQSFLLQNPKFKGCIYVDDLEENRETASKFGFESVDFNLEKIKDENDIYMQLEKIGELLSKEPLKEQNSRWH